MSCYVTALPVLSARQKRPCTKERLRPHHLCLAIFRAHKLYLATMAVFHENELHNSVNAISCTQPGSRWLQRQSPDPTVLPCPSRLAPATSGLIIVPLNHSPGRRARGEGAGWFRCSGSVILLLPSQGHLGSSWPARMPPHTQGTQVPTDSTSSTTASPFPR